MKIALAIIGLLGMLGLLWGVYFSVKRHEKKNKK